MLKRSVEALTLLLGWVYRRRCIQPPAGLVRVNLGSSLRVAPGWINVDGSLSAFVARLPTPLLRLVYRLGSVREWYSQDAYINILRNNVFVFHNLNYGIPLPDESVDFVYSSHLLEHLYKENGACLVQECFRTLRKGGRIRIVVPDLEYAFSLYRQGEKERALDLFYLRSCSGLLGRHEYMYDFDLLAALLTKTGFAQVERCAYQQGSLLDLRLLDHMPEESLFVEAVKL